MTDRFGRASRGAGVMLACVLLSACERGASTAELMTRGEQFMARRDYRAATIELKNAVAADAGNARARWLLGKAYLESGDLESAAKELDRARELGMAGDEVLPLLAQALLPLGRHDELNALSTDGLSARAQAPVLAAQGLSLLGKGDLEEGGKRLEEALTADPESAYVRLAHVRLLLANAQTEAGRKQLEDLLEREPGYAPAWGLLGDLEQQQQHQDLAEHAYAKAFELDPADVADLLKLALVRIQLQKADLAARDIDTLGKLAPRHPGVRFAEGLLHLQKNEIDAARTSFELAVRDGNGYPLALFYLAGIHAQQGNQEQADTYASQFVKIAPDNAAGRNLAASIAMRAGDFARVERLARPVVAANGEDVVALNLLASALIAQGKTDEGLDLLAKVAALQPDSALAQTRLAAGLIAAGQGGVGVEHLRKALELDPRFTQADVLLVMNHLQKREFPQAIEAAQDFQRRNPESATPFNLLGRVYLATNRTAEARQAFVKALELEPGDPGASQSLAAFAVQEKDYAGARRYYEGVLAKHPDYLPAQMQLAALDFTEGHADAMAERLKKIIAAHPDAVEPRLVLARYHLERREVSETLAVLNELDETQKKLPEAMAVTAAAQLAQNGYAAAKPLLERLVQLQPAVAQHHYQLAMAQAGLGDSEAMERELEKAVELDPKHFAARLALARALLARQDAAGFEAQLGELRRVQPDNVDVLLLEAALARQQGDNAKVLAKLEQAHARSATPVTVQNLALERVRRGDKAEGIGVLEAWLAGNPQDTGTRMVLADLYTAEQRTDDAVAQYEQVAKADPRNAMALNNLAWHLRKTDPKRALGYAESARSIAPEAAPVLDTLAMVLLENRQLERAQAAIEQALKSEPKDPGMRYHAALIRSATGDRGGAVLILEPLVNGEGDFAEKAEAQALLIELKRQEK